MPRALQPENCFVIFMWRAAFVCQTSRFFQWGNGPNRVHASHSNAQGIYCPLLVFTVYCLISTSRTKWLRIDCSNLFILRLGGSVSHPKITLKSDYIQFLTPGTNFSFGSQPIAVHWCVSESCVCMCLCGSLAFVYISRSVCVSEREATTLHGAVGGYPQLSRQLFCRHSRKHTNSPQNGLYMHCNIYP